MDEGDRQPLHAFVVEDYNRDGVDGAYWTEVGIAFPHKDGDGFNLVIRKGISVSGKIVLTVKKPRAGAAESNFRG